MRGEKMKTEVETRDVAGAALTVEQKKNSPLIGHFAKKINVYPIFASIVYTAFLVLAIKVLSGIILYDDMSGVNMFSRRGGEHDPAVATVYMSLIVIVLLILDLISLFKIKVTTGRLEEDIQESKESIQSLDEEFLRSHNIGHDIWVGSRHIFFSSGRHAYMLAKEQIHEITQEKARSGWKKIFRPTYILEISTKDGREARIDTFDGRLEEKLKKAV